MGMERKLVLYFFFTLKAEILFLYFINPKIVISIFPDKSSASNVPRIFVNIGGVHETSHSKLIFFTASKLIDKREKIEI